jgi:hypothetical protein
MYSKSELSFYFAASRPSDAQASIFAQSNWKGSPWIKKDSPAGKGNNCATEKKY